MRVPRYRLIFPLLGLLLCSACGQGTGLSSQLSGGGHVVSGFQLETQAAQGAPAIDAGSLRLTERQERGHTVVEILARRSMPADALLLELSYDARRYSPLDISAAAAMGSGSEALIMQDLSLPGRLSYGHVPLGTRRPLLAAGSVVATALFDNTAMQPTRGGSGVPVHNEALSPLFWDPQSGELTWYYNNPGDFDQNGIVGLSDLVPLAVKFGEAGPFDYFRSLSVVDGNRDGEIGISDVSVIGLYWRNSIDSYNVYSSPDIADVPMGYGDESSIEPIATLTLADSLGDPSVDRRYWVYAPENPTGDEIFWIRPQSNGSEGLVSEGTRSNINGGGLNGNPDIGEEDEDFNFLPEARMSLRILGFSVPLPVELDASASTDDDGDIIFYEWDFEGDGLYDAYGFDPIVVHNYIQSGTYAPLVRVTDNSGGSDSFQSPPFEASIASISNIQPSADIAATAVSGIAPLTIGFIGSGSFDVDGILEKYEWDFDGDGTFDLDSGSDSTVLFSYSEPGSYTALLRVTDNSGDTAEDTIEIGVSAPAANLAPIADVTANPTGGTVPLTVNFDAGGSVDNDGSIKSYIWNWNDNGFPEGSGTDPTVSHTFTIPGTFEVALSVIDDQGATDFDTIIITAVLPGENVPPTADLIAIPGSGVAPLQSIFDASGSSDPDGFIADYEWAFTDGGLPFSSGTDPTVSHTFSSAGDYMVVVTVTDNDGDSSLASFLVQVDAPAGNIPPSADVFAVPLSGDSPLAVSFSGAGSTDSDGNIVSYVWDWNDGSAVQNSGADPTVGHTFTVSGVYDVQLTVQDDDGATASDTVQINVTNVVNEPPVADVYASVLSGEAPLSVPFTGAGSTDPDGVIVNYAWDWDDASTTDSGADPSVVHSFTAPGTYNVVLTVTDNNTATDTDTISITVLPGGGTNLAPTASFTSDITSYTGVPLTVHLNPAASMDPDGVIARYDWDWEGDGLFDASAFSNATVVHTYTVFAEYHPTLRVTDDDGAWDDHVVDILPDIPPIADITATPNPAGLNETVNIDASGSDDPGGTITKFEFDLDANGSYETDNGTNPLATTSFASAGDYTVKVRITDNDLNTDVATVVVQIRIAELITVTTAGSPGSNIKVALIGGNPAIVYYDFTGNDLKFVRATNAAGTSWASPVTVAASGDVGRQCHLAEVSGRPAVIYNNNAGGLYFLRAEDATGSAWVQASAVQLSTGSVGDCEMEIISGNPAVAFHNSSTNVLSYRRASAADGSSWNAVQTINSGGTNSGGNMSLAVVNGMPAVAFFYWDGSAGVKYRRATNVDGTAWGTVVVLDSNASVNDSYDNPSLFVINGNPAVSYESRIDSHLVYKRASNVDGTAWGSRITISGVEDNGASTLLWSNSLPFVAYFENNNNEVRMAWGSDANGAVWDAHQFLDTGDNDLDSIEVGGKPFIVYFDTGVNVAKVF